jgi:hypothetical protein
MDTRQFDRIARFLANHRLSRRRALASGGTGLITGAVVASGIAPATSAAQGATPVAGDDVELLFVQSFSGGTVAPSGEDGAYTMTLEGGLGETIYFSDRPNREVGAAPTSEFITVFDTTTDDPPNAALVAGDMILVAELTSASLDEASGTLTYEATLLGEEDVDMQFEHAMADAPTGEVALETSHLFIDGVDQCCDPIHRPWCC